jgi:small subunit ribosomal protein S10e
MIISKKEKITIYTDLFKNGAMVIKREKEKLLKNKSLPAKILLKGLCSKGLVKETFSWQFYYYTLNDDGVQYLQNYLNIPKKVVPLTHKQPILWN